MNSFSLVSAAPAYGGSAEPCEAIGASLRTEVRIFNTCILCQILHSFPYFFITIFPTAFYDRSRMTGRYLVLLKNVILDRIFPSFKNDRQVLIIVP